MEQGAVPIADPLRKIASRVLNDVWRVSEITERAVHSPSRKHRGDLGDEPSLRVLKRAHWYAENLRAGGRRARRKTEVELFTAKLETLQDQFDLISDLEATDTLDRLMEELDRQGLHDIRENGSDHADGLRRQRVRKTVRKIALHPFAALLSSDAPCCAVRRHHLVNFSAESLNSQRAGCNNVMD